MNKHQTAFRMMPDRASLSFKLCFAYSVSNFFGTLKKLAFLVSWLCSLYSSSSSDDESLSYSLDMLLWLSFLCL